MKRVGQLGLWAEALGVGGKLLLRGEWKTGAKALIAPIGYWRCLPFAVTKAEFDKFRDPTVLDIGIPKMLSILLARHTKGQVLATDLDDPAIFDRWDRTAKILGLSAYRSEIQDARNLKYAENTFDLVYSISVIEHIAGDGDIEALREIARVLKPNGVARSEERRVGKECRARGGREY